MPPGRPAACASRQQWRGFGCAAGVTVFGLVVAFLVDGLPAFAAVASPAVRPGLVDGPPPSTSSSAVRPSRSWSTGATAPASGSSSTLTREPRKGGTAWPPLRGRRAWLCQSLNLRRVAVPMHSTLSGCYEPDATVAWTSRSRRRPAAPSSAGVAPSARRCTNRSRGTSRPTWGSPARGTPMGTACRRTWSGSSAATSNAAFWPTASPVPGAGRAGTIF